MTAVPAGFQYYIVWEATGDKLVFKESSGGSFCDACKSYSFAKGQGGPGRAWEKEDCQFAPDVQALDAEKYPRLEVAKAEGIHSCIFKFQDGCVFEYGTAETLDAAPAI